MCLYLFKTYIVYREKMAFFTRANITVPVLPSDEVSESHRFEYTVDRTLGVEV